MALQPPSFFERAPSPGAPQPGTNRKSPPTERDGLDLARLRKENQLLREQLQSMPLSRLQLSRDPVHPPGQLSHDFPAPPPPNPALLTSDLLQVEAHLQSRVSVLEKERKELALQVLELEKAAVAQQERHRGEVETLRTNSQRTLLELQGKAEEAALECQSLQRDKEKAVCQLEEGLAAARARHAEESEGNAARIKQLEEQCAAVSSELSGERRGHEEEVGGLQSRLAEGEGLLQRTRTQLEQQISGLQSEVAVRVGRVCALEAYLGGALPPEGGGVVTWRQEREQLQTTITDYVTESQRVRAENKLLQTRLSSISEILSIQEADITKSLSAPHKEEEEEEEEEEGGPVWRLLGRWREKVFVLLVQQRLTEMRGEREEQEAKEREKRVSEQLQQLEREKELLAHTLADRTAELELQTSKTKSAEHQLEQCSQTLTQLRGCVLEEQGRSGVLASQVQCMAQALSSHQTTFSQALSRLANYEHRLSLAASRLVAVKASLGCHYAVVQRRVLYPVSSGQTSATSLVETASQTEPGEGGGGVAECFDESTDFTSFSRAQLVQEVRSLCRERASLSHQLSISTAAFEQQLATLNTNCVSRLAELREALGGVEGEREGLLVKVGGLEGELGAVQGEREGLLERVGLLEGQLREAQATLDTRVEAAVLSQREAGQGELREMQQLLAVARREHCKAVAQLQQLQRGVARERDGAVAAAELRREAAEHQLEQCRRKLQSLQVERNLLLTTLRQEGIVVPVKRPSPRINTAHQQAESPSSEGGSVVESPRQSSASDATYTIQDEGASVSGSCQATANESSGFSSEDDPAVREADGIVTEAPQHLAPQCGEGGDGGEGGEGGEEQTQHQDIRDVLKDLQMLSASLLELEGTEL